MNNIPGEVVNCKISHGWNFGESLVFGNFNCFFSDKFCALNGVETDRNCIPVKKLNIYE